MWQPGYLVTPPLSCGALPGITRATVLELARVLGVPTAERAFGWTSSRRGRSVSHQLSARARTARAGGRASDRARHARRLDPPARRCLHCPRRAGVWHATKSRTADSLHVIVETIVTTVAEDGAVNCAPMGVEWGEDVIVLKPFLETTTYRNVVATGAAVVNLIDDVRVFAHAAIANPQYPTVPAVAVRGVVLADCCSWREVEVRSIDSTPPRSRIDMAVVHHGTRREFIGFNRARHAVLEAAIYATRLHLLPRAFVESELARLQVIVDKTAGAAEFEAMALLTEHVRSTPVPRPVMSREASHTWRRRTERRADGLRRGAGAPAFRRARPPRRARPLVRRHRRGGAGADAPRLGARAAGTLDVSGEDARSRQRFRAPVPGSTTPRDAGRTCACTARSRRTPGSARVRSSRLPSRARWPICMAFRPTRSISRRAVGRARRSAIGTWTFAGGGLVVEGGRRESDGRRTAARPSAIPAHVAVRRRRARRPTGHQRQRRSGGVRAAAVAARGGGRACRTSRADGPSPGARGGRSRDVR